MHLNDTIQVKSNLRITVRERGKIVARRQGHNIWLDFGRQWLAELIGYSVFGAPPTPERDDRIRYMGLGIGGIQQAAKAITDAAPLSVDYPGGYTQTDTDPTVLRIERPVRVSWTVGPLPSPYDANDTWVGQVAPPTHPAVTQTTFVRLFDLNDVNGVGAEYPVVPLSEIGLYTNALDPHANPYIIPNPPMVAYDTFDTIIKTNAFSFEVDWTIRF